ncbi:MAG: hypothetical protein ACR2P8_03955 [Myxococcota bacterium]
MTFAPPTHSLPAVLLLALLLHGPAQASITGVCPDGSMFIVKKEADIPCKRARKVEPQDMPPIRPHYLPRPYAWERHQQRQNPNNPYNLLEHEDELRALEEDQTDTPQRLRESGPPPTPQAGPPSQPVAPGPPPVAAGPPAAEPLLLSADDTRDLGLIIELTQTRIPARIARGEPPTLTLDLAYSRAFDARLHDWFAGEALGAAVLFRATAVAPEAFHANLTFVQGHGAFTPDRRDRRSFAILDGALGSQPAGGVVLGYAVLPEGMDPREPIDVYWNDRRISVVLAP